MEEVAGYAIGLVALIAVVVVQALIGIRSAKNGDGTLLVWAKSGCAGGLAMIGVLVILFVVGNAVTWLQN